MKNKLSFKKLPHQKHAEFLDDAEIMVDQAYTAALEGIVKDVLELLVRKKLAKSDDRKRGWTGEVPKIEADLDQLLDKTLSKYIRALKYILLGKAAGTEAEEAAKATGVNEKAIPGVIQSAYLDSLDTHREYYDSLTGKPARTIPKELIRETMGQIQKRVLRYMDESLLRLKNKVITAVEMEAEKLFASNIVGVITGDKLTEKMAEGRLSYAITEAGESYRADWNRMTSMDITLASAVGTHQAVQEIYSGMHDDVKVAWVAMRDELTCKFCKDASRYPDGTFKLYSMDQFEPAGYNYAKKRADWKLCIPGAHPNCRCNLLFIPKGFEVLKNGTVQPLKKI